MSLIDGVLALLSGIGSDAIAVHEERCISVRNRNADCLRCVEACTSGALSLRGNELVVEPERCIGCGTCATACPTCAIELRNPTDEELTAQLKRSIVATKGHPVVVCETALAAAGVAGADAADACVVPCLGRIDESALVGLAAYRAFDATLACGSCETCPHAPGGALARKVAASAKNLLAAFGSSLSIEVTERVPERVLALRSGASARGRGRGRSCEVRDADGGMGRREFFKSAKDASARAAGAAVAEGLGAADPAPEPVHAAYRKVGPDGTLSHFVPTRRVRLYNYLRHVGDGRPVADEVETRVIGAVSIDAEACSSCRMCAVFCPTGAIKKIDEDGVFGVVHRPSACMQCRLCERICPKQAITVSGLVPIRQFMGKEAVCFPMKRPTWTPNKPESMYNKVHSVLGEDLEMCMF
ncbi:MAG TPA: 4Fe-4S binding protein [Candidatus Rubneribacter avistercoris]|nr:4Fe-4S binding protein [Candidatus Rubneribacter avistercoris]